MTTAIVCGARDFSDLEHLETSLNHYHKWWKLTHIITGGARRADTLIIYPDWDTHGKSAGFIHNREMLNQQPEIVIAFKGGNGTKNMIQITRQAVIPVFII